MDTEREHETLDDLMEMSGDQTIAEYIRSLHEEIAASRKQVEELRAALEEIAGMGRGILGTRDTEECKIADAALAASVTQKGEEK